MKINSEITTVAARRGRERGAALVMSLLCQRCSYGGRRVDYDNLDVGHNGDDSAAEMASLLRRRSRVESTLSVLRGHAVASPALGAGETIDFRQSYHPRRR